MFYIWDFLVFATALSLAAFSPGPGLAAIVATVLSGGIRNAIWFCAGIIAGDLVWLSLSLGGLALIAQQIPIVFDVIKWIGVIYLLFLAVKIWRTNPNIEATCRQTQETNIFFRFVSGLSITLGNPKAMLFYIAIVPTLVSPERMSALVVLSLFVIVIAVLVTVFAVYAIAAERARCLMTSNQSVRNFNRLTATSLAGAALWVATK